MLKKIYFKSLEYLIYTLPLSIIFSNFFANFTVYYVSIYGLFLFIFSKNIDLIKNKYAITFILFCLYLTFRSLLVENDKILISLKSSLTLIRYLFFYLAFVTIINTNKNFLDNFFKLLTFILIFLMAESLIQFFFEKNIFGQNEISHNRISGLFDGRYVLGTYISKLIFLYLFLLNLKIPFNKYKIIYLIILIFTAFLILISGDRAALGIFIIALTLMIFLLDKNYLTIKYKILIFLASLIFISGLIFLSDKFKSRFIHQTIGDFKSAENIFYFSKGHESHWKTSYKMFLSNKFYGQGPNMFRYYCDAPKFNSGIKSCSTHPHNYFIQLLGETGLVGFSLFSLGYLFVLFKLIKQFLIINFTNRNYLNIQELCISVIFFSNFWPIITTGNIFSSFTLNLIVLPLCFINYKRND